MSIRYKFHSEKTLTLFPLNGRKGLFIKELREYIQCKRKIKVTIINNLTQIPYSDKDWLRRSSCVLVKTAPQSTTAYKAEEKKPVVFQKSRGIPKNITFAKTPEYDQSHLLEKNSNTALNCKGDAILTILPNDHRSPRKD